jgi:hypothetical protein
MAASKQETRECRTDNITQIKATQQDLLLKEQQRRTTTLYQMAFGLNLRPIRLKAAPCIMQRGMARKPQHLATKV